MCILDLITSALVLAKNKYPAPNDTLMAVKHKVLFQPIQIAFRATSKWFQVLYRTGTNKVPGAKFQESIVPDIFLKVPVIVPRFFWNCTFLPYNISELAKF